MLSQEPSDGSQPSRDFIPDLRTRDVITNLLGNIASETRADAILLYGVARGRVQTLAANLPPGADPGQYNRCFKPEAMIREGRWRHLVSTFRSDDHYVATPIASDLGLSAAALFQSDLGEMTVIVAFGFCIRKDYESALRHLHEYASQCFLAIQYQQWPIHSWATTAWLIHEITSGLEGEAGLHEVVCRIGRRLHQILNASDRDAHCSIWIADFLDQKLICDPAFAFGDFPGGTAMTLDFSQGLIGWAALNRMWANVLVNEPDAYLPDGDSVSVHRVASSDPKRKDLTEAELVIPMLYQRRLTGVLNVESPEKKVFPSELVSVARAFATLAAQAIHQKQLDSFYRRILGIHDLKCLADTIAHEAGNLIEASFCSIFLWDRLDQSLRLMSSPKGILNAERELIAIGSACYSEPGIGFTRWAFENKFYIYVDNCYAFSDPGSPECREELTKVLAQVKQQIKLESEGTKADVELLFNTQEGRFFWGITSAVENSDLDSTRLIPCPIWSNTHFEGRPSDSQAILVMPILDIEADSPDAPALGVMRFSRRSGHRFSDQEAGLLHGIARQCAQVICRERLKSEQKAEREALLKIVRMGPGHWHEGFQRRLNELLQHTASVLHADAILIRVLRGEELSLEAAYPTDLELSERMGRRVIYPKLARLGQGGSGLAAKMRETVHIPNFGDERFQSIRTAMRGRPQASFVDLLRSETAVPILWDGRLIGTITAVGFQDAEKRVSRHPNGHWISKRCGVGRDAADLLRYHASWLGLALQTIQEMVQRDRQISSLSAAIELVEAERASDTRAFEIAALVVATHHDALRFHQAFLATCERHTTTERWIVKGTPSSAWGATTFKIQDEARTNYQDLVTDIRHALDRPHVCEPIRDAWAKFLDMEFPFELPMRIERPCIVERVHGVDDESVFPEQVDHFLAQSGDTWDIVIDLFCDLLDIPLTSDAARQLQVGIVPLGSSLGHANRTSLIFVTNVTFTDNQDGNNEHHIDKFSWESVGALLDLGPALKLGYRMAERDQLATLTEELKQEIPQVFHRLIEPLWCVDALITVLFETNKPDPFLSNIVRLSWEVLRANRETFRQVRLEQEGMTAQPGREWSVLSVKEIISAPIHLYEQYFQFLNCRFQINCPSELEESCFVEGNQSLLQSVLIVLLDNASKAITDTRSRSPNPVVFLNVRRDQELNSVRFEVSDNGLPVSDERKQHLFEDGGSTWGGFGCGLKGSRKIAAIHLGNLDYEDSPKTFFLQLPLARTVDPASIREETMSIKSKE
jgi:GAF domain-containing protein/signal transduction histidine kinase